MSWPEEDEPVFSGLFAGMDAAPLKAVTLSADRQTVTFEFDGADAAVFGVEGDCCSESWIEHMDVPPYVIGEKLIHVQESESVREDHPEHDCLQTYQTHFRTAKGDIVLEYRNASNGYYGGSLVRKS